ncbi:hypothetical protein Esti_004781 [Eimeria stiedai]
MRQRAPIFSARNNKIICFFKRQIDGRGRRYNALTQLFRSKEQQLQQQQQQQQLDAASSKALHARRSSGDASPADCEAAASRSSSFFSKPLQRQTQGREIIEHATTRNLGFLLHLSGVRFAKMGPSKGRGPLIAKFAPVGFKKGFGAVGLGRHTKKGFFLINSMLIPKLHVPENVGSEVKPLIQNQKREMSVRLADVAWCLQLKPYVSPETFKIATQKFWDDDSNSLP